APVMPRVADAIREQLGLPAIATRAGFDQWPSRIPVNDVGRKLAKGAPIFPRLEKEKEAELKKRFSPQTIEGTSAVVPSKASPEAQKSNESKAEIQYDDFAKIAMKVGVVVAAERVPKKDKLLDLKIDLGEAAPRRIIAGIAQAYAPEA